MIPSLGDATRLPDAAAILSALDPEQSEVAAQPLGPMRVLAGAGTGKTRTITHRIAYGVSSGSYQPHQVLALTFTARAAGEMRTRLQALGVTGVAARTFHAAALRQLNYFWPHAVGGALPAVLPSKAGLVIEAANRLNLRLDRTELRDVVSEIEWSKVNLLTADSYPEAVQRLPRTVPVMDATSMARTLATYEQLKTERGVIDFEDGLLLTVGILEDRADIAEQVRRTYRHFVVDEYQDVNAMQQRLLRLWLGESSQLCVVGDPAQTIYSFTGATASYLLEFPSAFPGARTVELVRNYRSTPQIVALANALTRGPSGMNRISAVSLQPTRTDGPPPQLRAYPDDEAEAAGIATSIREILADGYRAGQVAILFRTNGQSEAFEAALTAEQIPYLLRGGERFFARREVKEAIVLLRGAARSDDGGVGLAQLTRDILGAVGLSEQAPAAGGAARERWESLTALVGLAEALEATDPQARLPQLLTELEQRAAAQHPPTVEGVTLASLHAAKGLEWPVVFLAGCSDGLIPIGLAEGAEAIAEERRLLYVGLTRARDKLIVTWARARQPGGRAGRRLSPFLQPLSGLLGVPEGQADDAPGGGPRRGRRARGGGSGGARLRAVRCRGCGGSLSTATERAAGRCVSCPPGYDEALYERLREWRRSTAAAASVPAFVVFTDATLGQLAEVAPRTVAELAAIPGVGPVKIDRYGPAVLAVIDEALAGQ